MNHLTQRVLRVKYRLEENVMKGYYKNSEATEATFTTDGWLKTGDLGIMKDKRLYIKGRIKTMLLSANGQNIYPRKSNRV